MNFCQNCGSKITTDDKFCLSCGAKIPKIKDAPRHDMSPNKKFSKKIIFLFLVVILLAIVTVFLYFIKINQNFITEARNIKRTEDLQNLKVALTLYYIKNDTYPKDLDSLAPMYILAVPQDPYFGKNHNDKNCDDTLGSPAFLYKYVSIENGQKFTLQSCLEGVKNKILTVTSYE